MSEIENSSGPSSGASSSKQTQPKERWTMAEDELIKKGAKEGKSPEEISPLLT
jgi:hypothetical protein